MKSKRSKWDLFWIIPGLIGSLGIGVAAGLHISNIPSQQIIGLMEWTYNIGLVLVVLGLSFKGFGSFIEELREAFK